MIFVMPTSNITPPPLRILVGLLSAKEQLCARAADLGGLFEVRMLRHQIERAQTHMGELTTESGQIVKEETDVRSCLKAAMSDGVITPSEAVQIQREVSELSVVANLHHAHLRRLV